MAVFALASVLGGVLGLFRLSVLKKTETEQQLPNAFVPLNVLVQSLGMAAFGVLFLHIGWIPPLNLVFFRSFVICYISTGFQTIEELSICFSYVELGFIISTDTH